MFTPKGRLRGLRAVKLLLLLAMAGSYLLLSSMVHLGAAEPAKDPKSADEMAVLLKARVALAKTSYRAVYEDLRRTKRVENALVLVSAGPEDAYLWSVRWLQSERDLSPKHEDQVAALQEHLKRMTELKEGVLHLSRDLMPPIKVKQAEWYRLEAQLWLARAKAK